MFYYYLGAITFALVIAITITRLIDALEHHRKRKHRR